jgi:type I restriction enzyme M protein
VSSVQAPSWADFITTIVGFRVFGTHRFSLRTKPLQSEDLQEFVTLYANPIREDGERHRTFDVKDVLSNPDCRLDLTWSDPAIQSRAPGLARLDELSKLVADDLQRALDLIAKPHRV